MEKTFYMNPSMKVILTVLVCTRELVLVLGIVVALVPVLVQGMVAVQVLALGMVPAE
jgi:hypothetical protein